MQSTVIIININGNNHYNKHSSKQLHFYKLSRKAGPAGQSLPAQVHQSDKGVFKAEFVPRVVGEHRIHVTVCGLATAGSPYAAKVWSIKNKFPFIFLLSIHCYLWVLFHLFLFPLSHISVLFYYLSSLWLFLMTIF